MNKQQTNERVKSLIKTLDDKSISRKDLELKTGLKQQNISRFFKTETSPNLITFIKVADAVGYEIKLIKKL